MAPSTAFPAEADADKPCDKCGAPASWADDPYSPFYVERQIPTKNWRDAFEDLLVLDSGGQMIDPDARHHEAFAAKRLWSQNIRRNVSTINQQLKENGKMFNLYVRIRDAYTRKGIVALASGFDEQANYTRSGMEQSIAHGQSQIAMLEDNESRITAASIYKSFPHWVTSLVSSGAIIGWSAKLFDSSEGLQMSLSKTEPTEDGYYDGLSVTEMEMVRQFQDGIPMRPGDPLWSTANLQYPVFSVMENASSTDNSIDDAGNESVETKDNTNDIISFQPVFPATLRPMSILGLTIAAERTMLRSGKMSVNVLLTNYHTNGTIVRKDIRDDACKVDEEVDKAADSMYDMHNAWDDEARRQLYTTFEKVAKVAEDDLD